MSVVTSVIFTCSLADDECLEAVNRYFTAAEFPQQGLVDIGDHAGGGKAVQAVIAVGAFNYFDEAAFFAHLRSLKYNEPEAIRIYMNHEHEVGFGLTAYLVDGLVVPMAPEPWSAPAGEAEEKESVAAQAKEDET